MVVIAFGEGGVIENDRGDGIGWLEDEARDGIVARIPVTGPPGLDDALIGDELDIATDDLAFEHCKGAAFFGVDVGGEAGEGGELFGVEKRGVDAIGAGFDFDFLAEGSAFFVGGCPGCLLHGLLGQEFREGEGSGGEDGEGVAAGGKMRGVRISGPDGFFHCSSFHL